MSCSWLMPFASRVRIWFSTSLMVLAMVVSSCSQPTRMCYRGGEGKGCEVKELREEVEVVVRDVSGGFTSML